MVQNFVVVRVSEVSEYPSSQERGNTVRKQNLILRELEGEKANAYSAAVWNEQIQPVKPGDLVTASLRFSVSEHNGVYYQDINVREMMVWQRSSNK